MLLSLSLATGAMPISSRAGRPGRGLAPVDLRILQEAAKRAHLGIVILPMGRAAAESDLAAGRVDLLLPDAVATRACPMAAPM